MHRQHIMKQKYRTFPKSAYCFHLPINRNSRLRLIRKLALLHKYERQ
ncbi:hypothetical protein LEMLEM_LOCUS21701 [Lemmus lemmus]